MNVNSHVFIRADASNQIGTGHLVRCATLAQNLKELGYRITFLCLALSQELSNWMKERDLAVLEVHDDRPPFPLGIEPGKDDWLIVDHYGWESSLESAHRSVFKRILVIDDLANRKHDCDLLLDQNYFSDAQSRYQNLVSNKCRLMLGPGYALLRPEYARLRQVSKPKNGTIKRILVSLGGSDPNNDTALIMQGLAQLKLPNLKVEIIMGMASKNWNEIKHECDNRGFECHRNVNDMAWRMMHADLFIGAGGATTWERLCLGLPSLVFAIAENQKEYSSALAQSGYQRYLGGREEIDADKISQAVEDLIASPDVCRLLSEKSRELVDGLGTARVADFMHKSILEGNKA